MSLLHHCHTGIIMYVWSHMYYIWVDESFLVKLFVDVRMQRTSIDSQSRKKRKQSMFQAMVFKEKSERI